MTPDIVVQGRPRAATVDTGLGGEKRTSEQGSRLSLHRSSIVKQEVLLGESDEDVQQYDLPLLRPAGSSLNDLYDVQGSDLGKGSYGSVARATDKKSGVHRAIKTVFKPKIENVTRLKREILIMKSLDHPNIIRLFEVGTAEIVSNLLLAGV